MVETIVMPSSHLSFSPFLRQPTLFQEGADELENPCHVLLFLITATGGPGGLKRLLFLVLKL